MCNVVITIPSLVCLRRALRRWRSRASSSSSSDAAVPAGHVAVSVEGAVSSSSGPRRFLVRVANLSHPAFRELLRQAEEEYGFLDVLRRVSSPASGCSCGRCCRAWPSRSSSGDRESVTHTSEQVGSGKKAKATRQDGVAGKTVRARMQFVPACRGIGAKDVHLPCRT